MLNACQSWLRRSLVAALRAAFASARAALFGLAPRNLAIIAKNTYRPGSAWLRGRRLEPALIGLLIEPPGAIRRTHQRAGQHPGEPKLLGVALVVDELVRVDPPIDRVMPRRRAQV